MVSADQMGLSSGWGAGIAVEMKVIDPRIQGVGVSAFLMMVRLADVVRQFLLKQKIERNCKCKALIWLHR